MKKKLLTSLIMLSGVVFAQPYEKPHMDRYWCQQNWEKCKSFKEEKLKLKEKHILKERECLQKAKDFWSYKECIAQVKVQMKRERWELKQKFLEEAK